MACFPNRTLPLIGGLLSGWQHPAFIKTGLGIELPHWKYPVVANTETGQLRFDNYNGRWGSQEFLDQFLQGYAVEKARIEALKKGHSILEQRLDDGSVKLTVSVGGEA